MAIYHVHAKYISRSKGRSAVAAAAYRSGARIIDERTGVRHDYSLKQHVHALPLVTPDHSPAPGRAAAWNKAEAAEKRKDAKVAREIEIALPLELDEPEREALALELAEEVAQEQQCLVDPCIHANPGNPHLHLLCTVRQWHAGELTEKTNDTIKPADRQKRGLTTTAQADFEALRERVADIINRHLAKAGHDAQVDHRTLAAQGKEDLPTIHLGAAAAAMERQGIATERGDINRARLEARKHRPGAGLAAIRGLAQRAKPKPKPEADPQQQQIIQALPEVEMQRLTTGPVPQPR